MVRDEKGRFVKTRHDRKCLACGKHLSGYISVRCKSCGAKERSKKIMCSHNKPHSEKSRIKISIARGGNGITKCKRYRGYKYRAWRDAVFRRDNWTCRGKNCGQVSGKIEAHHIKGWSEYPKLRFIISNGMTLCILCHEKTDNYKNYKKKFYGNQFTKKRKKT